MVRWKKRYFVLKVEFSKERVKYLKFSSVKEAILIQIKKLYGEYGIASVTSGFCVKRFNPETGILYLRVGRSVSAMVAAALPLVTSIDREQASFSCLFSSATVRHANLFLKRYHERSLEKGDLVKKLSMKQKIEAKRKLRV